MAAAIHIFGIHSHRLQMLCPFQHGLVFDHRGNTDQRRDHRGLNSQQKNPGSADGAAQTAQQDVGVQHHPHIACNITLSGGWQ